MIEDDSRLWLKPERGDFTDAGGENHELRQFALVYNDKKRIV